MTEANDPGKQKAIEQSQGQRAEAPVGRRRVRRMPNDYQIEVGTAEELVKRTSAEFGDFVEGIAARVDSGNFRQAVLMTENYDELTHQGTVYRAEMFNPNGQPRTFRGLMSGDWKETDLVPAGLPIKLIDKENLTDKEKEQKLKLYRRLNPSLDPAIEVGAFVEPGAALAVAMRGKRNSKIIRLPGAKFPKGGDVTAVMFEDVKEGTEVNGEFILAYIQPR